MPKEQFMEEAVIPPGPKGVTLEVNGESVPVELEYLGIVEGVHTWGIIPPPGMDYDRPRVMKVKVWPSHTAIILPQLMAMEGMVELEPDHSPTPEQPSYSSMKLPKTDPDAQRLADQRVVEEAERQELLRAKSLEAKSYPRADIIIENLP